MTYRPKAVARGAAFWPLSDMPLTRQSDSLLAPQDHRLQRRYWPSLAYPYGALSEVPLTRQSDSLLALLAACGA